jgi:hypothetical protein
MGYCAGSSSGSLPTFRNKYRSHHKGDRQVLTLEEGPKIAPETSERDYHYWLRNSPEERSIIYFAGEARNSSQL